MSAAEREERSPIADRASTAATVSAREREVV